MSVRQILLRLLYNEVDAIERGTDALLAMRDRSASRKQNVHELREVVDQRHPLLAAAVRRRRRTM